MTAAAHKDLLKVYLYLEHALVLAEPIGIDVVEDPYIALRLEQIKGLLRTASRNLQVELEVLKMQQHNELKPTLDGDTPAKV